MPYTPIVIDLVTPSDSVHGCFEVCNENFTDINSTFIEITSLVSGSGFSYFKTLLTGGTSEALDSVDGDILTDGDRAMVIVGNNPARAYIFVFDDDNGGAEDSPYIITPDTNAGTKRWVLAARIPRTWKGASSPTTTDDYNGGIRNGDWWLYGNNAWICVAETVGAAVWRVVPALGTGSTNAAAGDHNHSSVKIASTAVSDWTEAVQDSAGAMFSSNTGTGLSLAYDDSTGKVNAAVSYGTTTSTACQGDDARLSDTRTPKPHALIDGTGHTATGLTAGHIVTATAATTYAFQDLGLAVAGYTDKTAPVDADYIPLMDSETTPTANLIKKLSWAYIKSVLKTYFDGVYTLANLGGVATSVTVAGHSLTGNVAVSASDVGLGNVVNVAQAVNALDFTQATSSPALLLDPPDNAVLIKIVVVVDTAASVGSPTCSVGISGDADRDMDELDSDLLTAGTYIVEPYMTCGTSGANISLTITPDSQTFAGRCYLHYVVPV